MVEYLICMHVLVNYQKQYKVKKVGVEKALNKFKKKYPGPYELRERQINEIQTNLKVPLLAFTHPKINMKDYYQIGWMKWN